MTKDTMLGRITQLLAGLPLERLGVVRKLAEVLTDDGWQVWLAECKKFVQKKPCWTGVVESVSEFFNLLSGGQELTLDALDGKEILAEASDLFAYIDSDFKNWGADERGQATEETAVEMHELVKDGIFAQFFGSICNDVTKLCFTQAQIKNFCVKHRNWLRADGYATLFLFRSRGNLFVACVRFSDDGRLFVYVYRFEYDNVWYAGIRHRVVLPQLAA